MTRATTDQRRSSGSRRSSLALDGVAFAVFAAAFAVGTLIHEFHSTMVWWIAVPVATAAFGVLLRPASPARLVLLLAMLGVESVVALPAPSNHQVVMGIFGLVLAPWWVAWRLRDPIAAGDPAELLRRFGPYLRVSFVLLWAFAALAKTNSGFVDAATSCSVWILESVPLVQVPESITPLVIGGALALELSVPLLLLFHRTRPAAIVLAFGFHLVSALAGHPSFSGFAWSMYALFLPPAVLARGVGTVRRALPEPVRHGLAAAVRRGPLTLAVLAGGWVAVRYVLVGLLPGAVQGGARHWGATLLCLAFMGLTGWVLLRLRRHWLPARGPRASLRVTNGAMLVGIGLLVLTAAMPYVGLKTRAAFTMFSNLRTEPGHWNHLLVPESARVFGWQDGGEVRFLGTDDADLQQRIEQLRSEHIVLLGARQIIGDFPDATVRYELDGVQLTAAPVSTDPVLGAPLSTVEDLLAPIRPFPDGPSCQQ